MPVETRISKQFGDLVANSLKNYTYGEASIKTGISQAYILAMSRGKVPSEPIIIKFAKGMKCNLDDLMIAAGYKEPALEDSLRSIILQMRGNNHSQQAKEQILDFVKEMLEKNGNGK